MKTKIALIALFALAIVKDSQAQTTDWLWAQKAENADYADPNAGLVIDKSGNVYIAGLFQGDSLQFGNFKLHQAPNSADLFLVKYDPAGNVLWAKTGIGW